MSCKCNDGEREFPCIQRGVGWCETSAYEFLLTSEQSFRNSIGTVGKIGCHRYRL